MPWQQILDNLSSHDQNYDVSLAPLLNHTLIFVSGADSISFLQGQCTCDFSLLTDDHFIRGAHCTPKGRMQSSFIALRIDEQTIALRVHRSIAKSALNALKKYAVFSKVELFISEKLIGLSLIGESSSVTTKTLFSHTKSLLHDDTLSEIWIEENRLNEKLTQETIAAHKIQLCKSDSLWHEANIQRGIAEVALDNYEKLLPQEINLQLVDGVSFKKGCYTGQEIVARLHYRGQLKKHMYRVNISSETVPKINDTIIDKSGEFKTKGSIINIVGTQTNSFEALVLCDDNLTNISDATLEQNTSAKIQWMPLPYAIS